jgi:hypothetical protein
MLLGWNRTPDKFFHSKRGKNLSILKNSEKRVFDIARGQHRFTELALTAAAAVLPGSGLELNGPEVKDYTAVVETRAWR